MFVVAYWPFRVINFLCFQNILTKLLLNCNVFLMYISVNNGQAAWFAFVVCEKLFLVPGKSEESVDG